MTYPRSSRQYAEEPAPESRQSGSRGHVLPCRAAGHTHSNPAHKRRAAEISLPANPLLGTRGPTLGELATCCLVQKRSCQRRAMTQDKVILLGVPHWVTCDGSFICSTFTKHLLFTKSYLQTKAQVLESDPSPVLPLVCVVTVGCLFNFSEPWFSNSKTDMARGVMETSKRKKRTECESSM